MLLLLKRLHRRQAKLPRVADVVKGNDTKDNNRGSGASRANREFRVLKVHDPRVRVPKVHGHRARKVLHAKVRVIASVADPVVIGPVAIVPEAIEVRVPVVIAVAIEAVMIEGRVRAEGRASMGLRWISSWRS